MKNEGIVENIKSIIDDKPKFESLDIKDLERLRRFFTSVDKYYSKCNNRINKIRKITNLKPIHFRGIQNLERMNRKVSNIFKKDINILELDYVELNELLDYLRLKNNKIFAAKVRGKWYYENCTKAGLSIYDKIRLDKENRSKKNKQRLVDNIFDKGYEPKKATKKEDKSQLCTKCNKNKVDTIVYNNGNSTQMCESCYLETNCDNVVELNKEVVNANPENGVKAIDGFEIDEEIQKRIENKETGGYGIALQIINKLITFNIITLINYVLILVCIILLLVFK